MCHPFVPQIKIPEFMTYVKSFKPLINENARVLILGSMPGVQSLKLQQYYAHPQNNFWRIMFALFKHPQESDYKRKLAFLQERGIALWDTLESCYRPGSSDSDITNEKANNFQRLFKTYPDIRALFFNGVKSYEAFRKKVGFELTGDRFCLKLPSSSPANNAIPFDEKLRQWSIVLEYLF